MVAEPSRAERAVYAALGPAPADARPHARWPRWRVALAYAILTALAAAAIWYVDLKAHRPAGDVHPVAPPDPSGA